MIEYTELHAHSHYSLLDGASSPDALAQRAAALGMRALALTDHDALYGAVPFTRACEAVGIGPLYGAELTLASGHHLTMLVADSSGWANLCTLITLAQANAPKGAAWLPVAHLADHADGLIALTGCRKGRVMSALTARDRQAALVAARELVALFGAERTWIELQHARRIADERLLREGAALADHLGIGYVATGNVHYATREAHRLHDLMTAIRHNRTLDQIARQLAPNAERYLKSASKLAALFAPYPAAITNTGRVAALCDFALPTGLQPLPLVALPDGGDAQSYLRLLCQQSLLARFGADDRQAQAQLDHELAVIHRAGLDNYFLVVWDVVRFAKSEGIRCQGRGSACNSLVAYLLGISPVDPLAHDLLFERFLSDERRAVPDIDLDLQADRREELIQYVYERYGHEHVAMACTFSTFRARGALRDTAKAMGIPEGLVAPIAKLLDGRSGEALTGSPELTELATKGDGWRMLQEMASELAGAPRHLGLHNGGMVLTRELLAERLPSEPAAMEKRTVVQWDKEALEEAGIIKLDLLGLRMLSVLAEAQALVQAEGIPLDLDSLPRDDPAIFDLLCNADTIGLFQLESRAQAQMLPRMRPRSFNDIIIAISLIRPGPLQGEMVHPFLRRRQGEEAVSYAHPLLEAALRETLGVILFQEQVLKVARDLAGFSAGQGELLRRALGNKNAHEALAKLYPSFVAGAKKQGVSEAIAEEVWRQLKAFGGYAFAKSHAAAFAVIVYQSAWLKVYHPAAFFCGLLNQQPMGFWSPAVLVGDAKRHGVALLAVDVQRSNHVCTLDGGALRIGLRYVSGLGAQGAERIEAARQAGPFADLADFCQRTRLPKRLVERLILGGACDGWGEQRRLLWRLGTLTYAADTLPIPDPSAEAVSLPSLSDVESHLWERETLGLATGDHLLSHYRAELNAAGILGSAALERVASGQAVRVAGLKVMHQAPPTAKGVHFLTLEDEDGLLNIIVRPEIYKRYRVIVRQSSLLIIAGTVQRRGAVCNVVATSVQGIQSAGRGRETL